MKTKLLICFCILTSSFYLLTAQVPQGFNYMAIARNNLGEVLPDQDLEITVGILSNIAPVTIVWEESHSVRTNDYGLFQIVVGDPDATRLETSSVDNFSDIEWQIQPMYLRTVVDESEMGTARLFSVPYAMVAGSAYNGIGNPFVMNGDTVVFTNNVGIGTDMPYKAKLAVMGDNPISEDPLFEVKRQDGQTMFAVYNQGIRINVPMNNAIKGAKGGFAIGGFDGSKGETYDLFTLNKDSARIYLDKTPDLGKGAKGGFAIGGFDISKNDNIQEYLSITPDSARIYVKDAGKGAKGGFAIGGFDTSEKGTISSFLDITKENYFIGHESGSKIPLTGGGLYNSVIGYQAGKNLTTGGNNTMLGHSAGLNATGGNNNILIGDMAGQSLTTGNHNTLIGSSAGFAHTNQEYNVMIGTSAGFHVNASGWNGSFNTFIGINSGYQIRNSKENVFLGTNAGYWLDNGLGNTFIGIDAGRSRNESGEPYTYRGASVRADYNTIIGDKAGYYITNGDNNLAIGYMAGYNNADGNSNVFIGNMAGFNETGSNKLYIANTAGIPLIYGDFSTGNVGIGTTTVPKRLNVSGDAEISGNISAGSVTAPVTGNITGNVNGNLTGQVNTMTIGKIYSEIHGDLVTVDGFTLSWDVDLDEITITNDGSGVCGFWYKAQLGTLSNGNTGSVPVSDKTVLLTGWRTDFNGFEIHFGQADGTSGWCSVWLQYLDGHMVGHYIRN